MGGGQSDTAGGAQKQLKVVLVGLPKAGTKSLVARMVTGRFVESDLAQAPLDWQHVKRHFEQLDLQLLPVGSDQRLWPEHLPNAQVLVFVVDGSLEIDSDAVAATFGKATTECELPEGTPVVILINKIDDGIDDRGRCKSTEAQARVSTAAATAAAACAGLVQCRVFPVSAQNGDNLDEAMRVICGGGNIF